MCSPMFDMPDHLPIEINENGDGPANPDDTVAIVCWCGDRACTKFMNDHQVILKAVYEDLLDTEARYCAIMDTLNVDFDDMFPNWPEE